MLKVALLAPIHNSLYARLVAHELLKQDGIQVCAIVVRSHWNLRRFRREFSRDGARLLRKVYRKYVLGDARFAAGGTENLMSYAHQSGLDAGSLGELARRHAIPYKVVSDHNTAYSEVFLKAKAPDLIAFTGGGLIRRNMLSIPRIGVLNCHTGILPQYRGMDVVEWTAAEDMIGDVGFGASLHLMDQGVDTGPIILKRNIKAHAGEDFAIIRERLEVLMVQLMLEGIRGLQDGSLSPRPQEASQGRQYYVMHPRIKTYSELMLAHLKK